jgi:hypothetical protein
MAAAHRQHRPGRVLRADAAPLSADIELGGLRAGSYAVTFYDKRAGVARAPSRAECSAEAPARFTTPPIRADLAVTIRRL